MPFNGSGSFSAPSVSGWPASPGAVISSTAVNTVINDIMAGLSAVLPRDGQSAMTGALNMGAQKITNVLFSEEAAAPNVPSAATVDVGAQPGRTFAITGTTTITSFGVAANGVWKFIRFAGAVPLTHSSNLRLPNSLSITARDGDALLALSLGSGVWEVLTYFNRVGPLPSTTTSGTYTPTGTVGMNVTTCTPGVCMYTRVGNVVTVSGLVTITQTSPTGLTTFDLSFPVASASTTGTDAAGVFATTGDGSGAQAAGRIYSNTMNDRFTFAYIPQTTGNGPFTFNFTAQYLIL